MNLGTHHWKCPRPDCKYGLTTYTEGGKKALSEEHTKQHTREDRENGVSSTAMVLFHPPRNYDILKLNAVDIGFLKTRGIKVDDNIECNPDIKYTLVDERLAHYEMPLNRWKQVLERAWRAND